jgi:hypothetical protein
MARSQIVPLEQRDSGKVWIGILLSVVGSHGAKEFARSNTTSAYSFRATAISQGLLQNGTLSKDVQIQLGLGP